MLLELRKVSKYFGGLAALSEVDMSVNQADILGLIGPNGAGKTTLFNVVTGFSPTDRGKVIFDGEDISRLKPHIVAKIGMVRTFQLTTLFPGFTVFQNVLVGFHLGSKVGFWEAILNTAACRKKEGYLNQRAMEILEFMGLSRLKDEPARSLPLGQQRAVGIAVALAAGPKLLLLDEPISGMTTEESRAMIAKIRQMRDGGITIVIVDHDMKAVMSLCDRIFVLNFGKKVAEGLPEEIRINKDVLDAYLGEEESVA